MQQLTGQDASFLYFETARTPMHIGSIQIYEQKDLPGGVQGFKNILAQVESRLHMARTFRQKVVRVPFSLDHPYWIEDPDFDPGFATTLPRGSRHELELSVFASNATTTTSVLVAEVGQRQEDFILRLS